MRQLLCSGIPTVVVLLATAEACLACPGQQESELNNRNGKKHGKQTHWDENGRITKVECYEDDQLIRTEK